MELITSKDNKKIKLVKKLMTSSSSRRAEGLFVCEGLRLCSDALSSEAKITLALFSEDFYTAHADFVTSSASAASESFIVKNSIFCAIADTKTPQGVLFVIKTLDKNHHFDTMNKNGKVLALENIGDPSNLGTILRSAEALGIDAVILSRDCCDVYAPKVIRGSMGAIFRLNMIETPDLPSFIRNFNTFGTSYAAVLDRNAVPLTECDFSSASLCVIGNEANGITDATVSACTHTLFIPMKGGAESLNAAAAAGIITWEMIK